jgi:diadenosine tetraphosphate (Ap4A) HIT family hydrolase
MTAYDPQNIFARILRGDIPCSKVYEDDFVLAFNDINPQAPVHVLVIPKGPFVSLTDFSQSASPEELAGFFRGVGVVVNQLGLNAGGYRTIANTGTHGGQEVPHFHVHILAGRVLGPMLSRS